MGLRLPRASIEYCSRCNWMLRSAWMQQELLTTFNGTLTEVSLQPNHEGKGIFVVRVRVAGPVAGSEDEYDVWDRETCGRFPEAKELKQAVRDLVEPGRLLGHSDDNIGEGGGESGGTDNAKSASGRSAFGRLLNLIRRGEMNTNR